MNFFLSLSFVFIGLASIAQTAESKNQIEKLIADESKFFYDRNFTSWANCYLEADKVQWVCVEGNNVILEAYTGSYLRKFVGDYLTANPTPLTAAIERKNFVWRSLGKDAVWVTFDESKTIAGQTQHFKGTRILEKKNGEWKIAGMFSYPAVSVGK
jgi:hypothetical protein